MKKQHQNHIFYQNIFFFAFPTMEMQIELTLGNLYDL